MKFSQLVEFFQRIEATTLRNEKTVVLAEVLKQAEREEVDKLVYLALGGLRPAFDRLEFNLAEKMILRAIAQAARKTVQEIEGEYKKIGDLGELIIKVINVSQYPGFPVSQSVAEVYAKLEKIARDGGAGSQERKVAMLANLINEEGPIAAKYIVRMVAGKLRLGFSDKTVIDALSYSHDGTKKNSEILERAYQIRPDPGVLAQMVMTKGVEKAVEEMEIEIGTPIVPALAQRLKTASEMIEKMGSVYAEPKFDGTRVQIHFSRKNRLQSSDHSLTQGSELGGQATFFQPEQKSHWVRTFTRNLDESSEMFPELSTIGEQIEEDEVILDSEAVGYDPKSGKLVPFQMTITRKRKHGIEQAQNDVPLKFFVFDIMYLNGKSLIHLPLSERKKILRKTIKSSDHSLAQGSELKEVLVVDEYIQTESADQLRDFHKRQLEAGLEGALVKQIDGEYMPGRTGFNWVKFKEAEDSRAKLADTLDTVIMGYYLGKGKRSTFGLGAFLIGIKNEQELLTIAKVGTGISDEQFGVLHERLKQIELKEKPSEYQVPKTLEPDVWVSPEIVVEVAADEITISPTHSAGYALRFPRLVKFRDDKSVNELTTLEEIKSMITA